MACIVFVNTNNGTEYFRKYSSSMKKRIVRNLFTRHRKYANKPYNPKHDRRYKRYYRGYFDERTRDPYYAYCKLSTMHPQFCDGIGKSACRDECK